MGLKAEHKDLDARMKFESLIDHMGIEMEDKD